MDEIKCFISDGGGRYFFGPKDKTIRYFGATTQQMYSSSVSIQTANELLGFSSLTLDEFLGEFSPAQILVFHAWAASQLEEPDDNCNQ